MQTEALNVWTVSFTFTTSSFLKKAERKLCDRLQSSQLESTWTTSSKASPQGLLSLSGECGCVFPIADWPWTKTLSIHKSQKGRICNQNLHERSKDYSLCQIVSSLKSVSILPCSNNLAWWHSAFLTSRRRRVFTAQPWVHNTAVGNTGILRAGKTSEFFLSPLDSDRKKEIKVCEHGWSGDLQVIG